MDPEGIFKIGSNILLNDSVSNIVHKKTANILLLLIFFLIDNQAIDKKHMR